MDPSQLESYVKQKSNGRNIETILILKSLLEKEVNEPLVEDALGQIDARVTGSHLFHVEIL